MWTTTTVSSKCSLKASSICDVILCASSIGICLITLQSMLMWRFLILGYLCYAPAMAISVSASFNLLLLAFFFFGLGQVLSSSSSQSLQGDLTPRESRGKVVGCSQFFIYLSQALTQLLVGVLYSYVWKPLPFVVLGIGTLPITLFVSLRVFEPKSKEV